MISEILGQPVNDNQIVVEFFRAVLREISLAGGHAPFIASLVRLHLSGENLEEGGFCQFVSADESNLVVMAEDEGDVVQNLHAVDGLADAFYGEHFISDFAVGTEINVGIFTAGRTDLIQLDFFQGTLYWIVACLDLEALALNREMNSCSSLIFSSFFLLASFI